MKKKQFKKAILCTTLVLSMSIFATACGNKDTASTSTESINFEAVSTDENNNVTDITNENESKIYAKDFLTSSPTNIWYVANAADGIKKDASCNVIVIEDNILSLYYVRTPLSDFSNMTDEEIIDYSSTNNDEYLKYDLNDMEVYFMTDDTGNNVAQETLCLPLTSIISFKGAHALTEKYIPLNALNGEVLPTLGEVYDSNYYGYKIGEDIWFTKGDVRPHLAIDDMSLEGAHIDEKTDYTTVEIDTTHKVSSVKFTDSDGTEWCFNDITYEETDKGNISICNGKAVLYTAEEIPADAPEKPEVDCYGTPIEKEQFYSKELGRWLYGTGNIYDSILGTDITEGYYGNLSDFHYVEAGSYEMLDGSTTYNLNYGGYMYKSDDGQWYILEIGGPVKQ